MAEVKKLSDSQRLKQAATYHGLAALGLFLLWTAADSWSVVTNLLVADVLSVVTALIVVSYLASIIHEWGHFTGARLAGSYSPIVPKVTGIFMFGFNYQKNSTSQFLSMSLGGPVANWLLVLLIFTLIPLDSAGRAALLAMAFAKAISVCVFEVPIMLAVMNGADPEASVDKQLANGAGDRGTVLGYLSGAVVWFMAA